MFEAVLISASGVWLALFLLVAFIALAFSIEADSFFAGSVLLVIFAGIAQFIFDIAILSYIAANPLLTIFALIFYAAIGIAYAAFWRLPIFVDKNAEYIKNEYVIFCKANEGHDTSFEAFTTSYRYRQFTVAYNKDAVASWVLLWPIGVLWELSHKPIRWLWSMLYSGIGSSLEKINTNAAAKIIQKTKKADK
jgi:hypothetical protein